MMLFVCENSEYAIGTEIPPLLGGGRRPQAYRRPQYPLEKIDGMDVLRVYDTTRHALDPIYAGGGPRVH